VKGFCNVLHALQNATKNFLRYAVHHLNSMTTALTNTETDAPMSQDTPDSTEKHSYGQILKSSALIGGSSVMNIAVSMVRTKAMAVLLGPAGFGLMSIYGSISDLAVSVASMGINSSGVRQIAEAAGSGDTDRIARTVLVLRRISIVLGVLGALLLVLFSSPVSALTFGDEHQASAVALLSLAVLFRLVSSGQGALIQGLRRIADMAKMGVLGSFYGTILSIPLVYFLREDGVVPALICVAAMSIITSWWYSRKVQIQASSMSISQLGQEVASLLKLGVAFMASGFFMMGAAYAVRTMVLRMVGFEAAGYYSAAWTLAGLYVGFILQAMGADFYPRLTGVAKDNFECNRMVNEQTQISLLLAGPGVLATLTFAAMVVSLFYSSKFEPAVGLLRWFCLGLTLRVITWPMGFIILAKGAPKAFFWTELAWTVVNVCLSWICLIYFGLNGAGIAFFGSYVFHGLMIYPVVRWLSGFRWSNANKRTGLFFLSSIVAVFSGFCLLPISWASFFGALALVVSGLYSIRVLTALIPHDRIPTLVLRLLVRFGLTSQRSER
jgi:enterobacterial common antigen flippase